jgi:pyruvate dehydrogenase E2 component (dihydrolipoamide acetyltransferase)
MTTFRMPSLGADMEAGTLVEWVKKPGDAVKRGDIIAVVETQKGATEIEVFDTGTVERLMLEVGATVPVGAPMAEIRVADEPVTSKPVAAPAAAPAPVVLAPGTIKASPAARKFAAEHGIALAAIQGSGPDGAILFVDVEAASQVKAAAQGKGIAPMAKPVAGASRAPAADGMRAAIAAAMGRSKREIPHYYLGHKVDVTIAVAWLAKRNAERKPEERAVFAALLLKAMARALASFPEFNGTYDGGHFKPSAPVHFGMAIALRGGGLIAPAIHDCADLSLDALMPQLRDLTNRVRAGRFRSSELADATITLTSLGERGVDWVQPIIYPPQVAIFGAGSPALRPWVVGEELLPRQICELTLAADHRVSDGHRGALLLRAVDANLQSPETL